MKFIRTTTKAYLILLIVISSFLISIHTETKTARNRNRSFNQRVTRNNSSKKNSKSKKANRDDSMEKGIKIFDFTLGLLTCLPGIDEYAEKIEELLERSDKCDKAEIIKAYKEGVKKRIDSKIAAEVTTVDRLQQTKEKLPWRPTPETEEKIAKLEATNPKKACQAILAEKERQIKENNKYAKVYEGALVAAKEIKKKNISFEEFLKKLPYPKFGFLNSKEQDNYLNLKHYFKKVIFDHHKLKSIEDLKPKIDSGAVNWEDTINDAIFILSSNEEMAKHNLLQLEFDKEKKPDCSKLPTDKQYENNKATILDKFAGGWSAIKYIGQCVIESLPNHGYEHLQDAIKDIIKDIGESLLKKLLTVFGSVVTNILSFFALKAVKILWWVIKAIYYVYKAIDSEESEKYKFWGKAVGSGIRVIYIAFMPTEKRRFKLKK